MLTQQLAVLIDTTTDEATLAIEDNSPSLAIMSRSFTPPSTLSKDEIRTIADVRRDIWSGAIYGLCVGSLSGFALHSVAKLGANRKWWTLSLTRNTAMMSFFLGGALGSFVMATTTGKNEVHRLHPIYDVGAKPPPLSYHDTLVLARQREADLRTLERRRSLAIRDGDLKAIEDERAAERLQRERNRLLRRASLARSFEPGHGGLNDSHGGHWVSDSQGAKHGK